MGKTNTTTPDQTKINAAHQKISDKAQELEVLVQSLVDVNDPKFTKFQDGLSDAMTVILTCPLKK